MKKLAVLCLSLLIQACSVVKCQRKVSPCPSVFTYDLQGDSNSIYYGTIKLQSSVTLHSVTVDVIFDRSVIAFGAYGYDGATSSDFMEFRIDAKNTRLNPGRTLEINVYVQYNNVVPLVKQVRLNGQNICVNVPIPTATRPVNNPANSNAHVDSDYDDYTTTTTRRSSVSREIPNSYDLTSGSRNVNRFPTTTTTTLRTPSLWSTQNNENNDGNSQRARTTTTTQRPDSYNDQWSQGSDNRPINDGNIFYRDPYSDLNGGNQNNFPTSSTTSTFRPLEIRTTTTTTRRPSNANSHTTTSKGENYFPGDLPFINRESTPHSILNVDDDNQCGTVVPKTNPLIVHGLESSEGAYPWHSALYFSEVGSLKYICGGSLISMSLVLTAAHCVTHSKSKMSVNSDKLLVYLGKHNLQKWTGQEQDGKVIEIVVHDEYDPERFYSDLALLKLKEALRRTNFVRPVCVWAFDSELRGIVDKLGSVPGWGYNENGLVSDTLTYVQMPVVTHETCIWSNRDFFSKVTSEKSFCAGFRNGTSICNGDSGGGLVFKKNNKWYIRGVVSVSIALQNTLRCDPEHYAVFVDVAKYTSWLNQYV